VQSVADEYGGPDSAGFIADSSMAAFKTMSSLELLQPHSLAARGSNAPAQSIEAMRCAQPIEAMRSAQPVAP
jgi:hypothetical protein